MSASETVQLTLEVFQHGRGRFAKERYLSLSIGAECLKSSCWNFENGLAGDAREAWDLLSDKIDKRLKGGKQA